MGIQSKRHMQNRGRYSLFLRRKGQMMKNLAMALICMMIFSLMVFAGVLAEAGNAEGAPDYSNKDYWVQFPEITKDVDTFYIYSTVYFEKSFEEGSTDYATFDNVEMLVGAVGEYVTNASVFEDSVNFLENGKL